ncbi:hypothetical protein [Stratiformator vulcanicus]|uniref:Uncharacterized protein n=1 Tax=Stratiformator vulcanicus TaxID=2527980 RepID=A0A517R6C7_9PLAN|nr:hypothetical protein [Stratiformator vulcanicus]QDT39412.1 hypothetical protein Pan189_38190 [Stratiformator vulcanicus]
MHAALIPLLLLQLAARPTVPDHAEVQLASDRQEYFLGENILVHYRVINTGGDPFVAWFGGDYRGTGRSERFKVSAVDAQGNEVQDPLRIIIRRGGFLTWHTVVPDDPYVESIPLLRFLRFNEPGRYVITIRHDCGWKESAERKFPEAKIELVLKQPSAGQARHLVERWLKSDSDANRTNNKETQPHPDFSVIRNATYLGPLTEPATAGNKRAISGVASIATPDATRLLIQLAGSQEKVIRTQARRHLLNRLPASRDNKPPTGRWLVDDSWQKSLAADVAALGVVYLNSENSDDLEAGAKMIAAVGEPDHLIEVQRALDLEVGRSQSTVKEGNTYRDYPGRPGACHSLEHAARRLFERGAKCPADPKSAGEAMLFAIKFGQDSQFEPEGWEQTCRLLIRHEILHVRRTMLENLPQPIPAALRPDLIEVFASPHLGSVIEALHIVSRDRLTEFRDPVRKQLRTARQSFHFSAADGAAREVLNRYERLEILVDRIDEPGMMFESLDALKPLFPNAGGGGRSSNIDLRKEARRIKPLWQQFLKRHQADLKLGAEYKLPHLDIGEDMFPPEYTIRLRDGSEWPE